MQRTLSRIALAVGLLAGAIAAPHAMADAPMVKTQAPGFYRVMVGDFEVTAISDGTVKLPMLKLMNNQPPEKIAEALKRGFLKEMVETSVNTYLINTGSKLVLVDTGAAPAATRPAAPASTTPPAATVRKPAGGHGNH